MVWNWTKETQNFIFLVEKKKLVKTEEQGGQKKPQIAAQRRHFTSTSPSFTHSL